MGFTMARTIGRSRRYGEIAKRTYCNLLVLLLIQFLFKFAQGQGPGSDDKRHFTVNENRAPGTEVGRITSQSFYTYTFSEDSIAKNYFNLDANTGRITTKVLIDREALQLPEDQFNILVLAQSTSGAKSPVEISIQIIDENDNIPYFETDMINVAFPESFIKGSQKYIKQAKDDDTGQNGNVSVYRIIAGDGPFELVFSPVEYGEVLIVQTTGGLDREANNSYMLTISAQDQGDPPRTGTTVLNITILDENDNPPIFDPSTFNAKVNETDPVGTFVIQVIASDRDAGVNQDITYEIIDDNEEVGQFEIEQKTGSIYTKSQPLFCQKGQCLLTVQATDGGMSSYTGRAFVYITVVDVNNHDPEIAIKYVPNGNTEYSSVNEDARDKEIVAGVQSSDKDSGVYGKTSLRIISGNELRHFIFETSPVPGLVLIRVNGDGVLDRERHHLYNLTLVATDSGNPPRSSTASLVIYVNDINDHAPVFVNKKVKLSISETTPAHSFIASMLAVDMDTGINAKLTYQIMTGNDFDWFHINPSSGLITTQKQLHYEIKNYFKMNISVHDGALNPFYDYSELEITIWDENDMAPLFLPSEIYNVSLEENLASVAPVVTASARDDDSFKNGTIVYQFHPSVQLNYPDKFYIDSSTGEVTTTKLLDREEVAFYTIYIIASDQGTPSKSSTATINLDIIDVNDNAPVFYPSNYYAKVIEGQNEGYEVVTVTATDLDAGNNGKIIYSFSSSDFNNFEIDAESGVITTKTVLQKNAGSIYTLTVLATDQPGRRSPLATVTVSVLSVTDKPPYFTSNDYKFSIPEDPGNSGSRYIGDSVGTVEARSDNPGASIQYQITAGDPMNIFTLDRTNGNIRRTKFIDREQIPSFLLEIVATSNEMFINTKVEIKVTDSNDNSPSFLYPVIDIDLLENKPVGHHIYRVSANDLDEIGPNSRIVYSLQNDYNNIFTLQSDTGVLTLNKPIKLLGTDSVSLTVNAMDSAPQPFTTSQELRLTVKDVNNHSPKFPHTTYELSLIESQAVNSKFFDVQATDGDVGDNAALLFNITRGNEDGKFGIFPDGNLFIAKVLDRETKDFYNLTIRAMDKGQPPRSSDCNITIHISDYNDNKPIFLNGTYIFSVAENKAAGAFVGYVKASDDDMGRNAELLYYFQGHVEGFSIDPQTGEITTSQSFDREGLAEKDYMVTFDVLAKDNGQFRLENVATVRVQIQDENDNAPVFRQLIYKVNVFENAAVFSNITVVKADDPDFGINSIVTYRILAGNEDNNFVISPTTGQIMLQRILDRETQDYYKILIEATDTGAEIRHSATTLVQITIGDINDNFPLFPQTHLDISVREDQELGSMVAHFPATDVDLGVNGEISYSMSGIDNDGTFGIDHHTGKIYLRKQLDYESKQSYRLNVTATDNGVPKLPYYIRFSITIEDVNDNYPQFQNEPLSFRITEHSSNIQVATIRTIDIDSSRNGEVQYSLAYQDPPGDHFKIVKNTGLIYLDKPVDREEAALYTLTVVATDQADDINSRLSTETQVLITVEDENDNDPEVISFDTVAVPRLTPRNEFIATFKASDPDDGVNGQISFQLVQSGSMFGLDSQSGRFYLAQSLPETPVKYLLTVQLKDYGNSPRTTQFDLNVIVTNGNQGPTFTSPSYSGYVSENSDAGTSILSVDAVSRTNSKVEYYVTNITHVNTGIEAGRYFNVGKTTGLLSTAAVLDREMIGSEFDVEIYVIDADGPSPKTTSVKARVQVTDVNDTPPRFSKNFYSIDVPENIQVDSTVVTLAVSDDDSLGGLKLTLDPAASTNLRINQNGSIITTGPLDRESQSKYTLIITATDGIQSSSCQVRINLLDVNDNAPKFTEPFYSVDVDEDTALGTTIGGVQANDPDQGGNGDVTYFMTSAWANDTFYLDPVMGTVVLRSVIDFEQNQLFTLVVRARDSGDPVQTSSVTVFINIQDVNDNTPLFEHGVYEPAVFENVTIGTSVIQVLATDIDSGINGEVEYLITDGDIEGHFVMDPEDGTIYTAANLDREAIPLYKLTVTARDRATDVDERRSSDTEVIISLQDVNDFTPEFISTSTIFVHENLPKGTAVHTVTAQDLDADLNGQVRYSILSQTGGSPFTIGQVDGQLRVNAALDRESVQNYSLTIVASDRGVPSLSATQLMMVMIDDTNDNHPIFNPTIYESTINENTVVGTTLLQVTATDLDKGLNGIVSYFIVAGDDNFDFYLDQSSGVLRVQKRLDFERVQKYDLKIQAEDSGDDTKYANATITVTILDFNDKEPVFLDSPYIGFVRENMEISAVQVLQVSAYDADSFPFNQLNYEIREGDRDLFNMSQSTGEIMALKVMDREETPEYILTVVAYDSTTGRGNTGSGTVSVFVEDVNDNPPIFEHNGTYVAHISENATVNTEVIVIQATDRDEGVNAQIMYSIGNSQEDTFTIYPDIGVVSTRALLDRETVSQYTLQIIAKDASMLPLSSTTTLIVYVDDINDNPPVFEHDVYTRKMLLPVNVGNFVCGVTATDADVGDNGLIVYSLSKQGAENFRIDSVTGVVTVGQPLMNGQEYTFHITATDKGSQPLSAAVPVTVTVIQSSSTPPTFTNIPQDITLNENPDLQDVVVSVTAVPSVTNAPVTYSIAGGNIGQAFGIEHSSGRIYVSGTVDYEVTQAFHLWIEAVQSGSTSVSSFGKVDIIIADINDNAPEFEKPFYNTSIIENSALGSPIATVQATDLDSGVNGDVTYSLSGADSSKFKIDSKTGKLVNFIKLDRENIDRYSLIVIATDAGESALSSTASVRVNILDTNDNPPAFERQFIVKIPENMEVGSLVIQVTSFDKDIGENAVARYSFTDDASGTFTIEPISGNITLNKPLDAEKNQSYNLRVSATDGGNEVLGNVEVEISDVNDNRPVIIEPYSFNFAEMSQPGSLIGKLYATDRDIEKPNNKTYFALKLASGFFHLDSDTGKITSLEMLYFDPSVPPTMPPNRHELVVVARDLGTPVQSSEKTIHINIMDFNDHAPIFEESSYRTAVPDNAQIEGSIIQVVAKDELDFGDNAKVEYFLAGGDGQALFHVNRFTGIVSVGTSLTGYRNKDFTITVKAEDKGYPPQHSTVDVQLVVTDINRFPPKFNLDTKSEVTIAENVKVETLITTFVASDQDIGMNAEVVFEITGGNGDDLFDLSMESGALTVKQALDYELTHQHVLDITVSDKALYSKQTTMQFVVKLNDVNDNDPIFATAEDKVFVEENTQIGVSVYQAIAADADSGIHAKIHYALVGDAEAQGKFRIDDETGILTVKGDLDYETKDKYSITIMALNPDSTRKSTMFLTVHTEGVNEYVPTFVKDTYYFSISESAPTKTSVGMVSATDDDAGEDGIVFFFLIGDSNAKGFKMEARTGIITVSAQPDYENSNSITLKVLAKNWGSVKGNDTDTCVIHISVEDANDAPRFLQEIYTTNIMEKSGPGVSIITVSAEDTDFDITDRTFSYLILAGNNGDAFRIDATTGYISTTGNVELDREIVPIYNLTVGAKDTGSPPQTGSALVQIHLDPYRAICGNTFCQNGGVCVNNVCQCPDMWTGPGCSKDVNECNNNICREGSTCQNTPGSFKCHCPNGLTGRYCENVENFCQSSPCIRGNCENTITGYVCVCPYEYWGPECQFMSKGFSVGSYMEFSTLTFVQEVTVTFATLKLNALLLYNPSSNTDSTEFVSLELVNGQVTFSIAVRGDNPIRISTTIPVNTGEWFKVKVTRNNDIYKLEVQKCPQNVGVCQECQTGSCVSQSPIPANEILDLGSQLMYLGGVRNISTILSHPGQVSSHDFVGCIQSFTINSIDKFQEIPSGSHGLASQCPRSSSGDVCNEYSCMNGGTCSPEWEGPVCKCTARFFGKLCDKELQPFGFSSDTLVKVSMKESVRRDAQVVSSQQQRRRRAVGESSVTVRFRITEQTGILVFASTTEENGSKYSLLSVIDGKLTFTIYQYGKLETASMETPTVSDGNWHNVTVTVTDNEVQIMLNGKDTETLSQQVFKYNSLDVKEITLGGAPSSISIGNRSLKDFSGCISEFQLDGKPLPMNGTTDSYDIEVIGGVSNGCSALCGGGACDGNGCTVNGEAVVCSMKDSDDSVLSIGIIVVIVFFVLVIIGIIVVFIVFRKRRQLCMKAKEHTKQNGATMNKSANSSGHSHQDSGYGENNIDELIIRNHIAQELAHNNKFHNSNGRLMTPDIIESDISRHPMPLEIEDGTVIIDNASDLTHLRDLNGDMPEHYDLENASSIAPSDIDIADHYRHYHDSGRHRRKNKSHSNHSHSNSQHSSRHHHSNHSNNHPHMMRDSPNLLSSVPYLNDLARNSPNLRNNHSPVNQLSRQNPNVQHSPLTSMNMKGHGMPITDLNTGSRTQSERSLASHRSKSSTPNKPKRQMLPSGPQKKISNNNYENKQFLTLEEVERLNARPRHSPASMQEAMSTSSENNTRKMQKPFNGFQDTSVLLEPPDSSSEDSANDSFTCSEFEYDNDKQKNDFDPKQRIFSKLPEAENEEDGAYHNKTFKPDGMDSGGNSFSSNMESSDEGKSKSMNNAFNWDDLLNWGPKFEKLVGVFTDIALLPDKDSPDFGETEGKIGDREEYV